MQTKFSNTFSAVWLCPWNLPGKRKRGLYFTMSIPENLYITNYVFAVKQLLTLISKYKQYYWPTLWNVCKDSWWYKIMQNIMVSVISLGHFEGLVAKSMQNVKQEFANCKWTNLYFVFWFFHLCISFKTFVNLSQSASAHWFSLYAYPYQFFIIYYWNQFSLILLYIIFCTRALWTFVSKYFMWMTKVRN